MVEQHLYWICTLQDLWTYVLQRNLPLLTITSFMSFTFFHTVHCKKVVFHFSSLVFSHYIHGSTEVLYEPCLPFLSVQSVPAGRVHLSSLLRLTDAPSRDFSFKRMPPQHCSILVLVGLHTEIHTFKGLTALNTALIIKTINPASNTLER